MFSVARAGVLHFSPRQWCRRIPALSSSLTTATGHPNPPLDLDASLRALLKDADISLAQSKTHRQTPPKELEAFPVELEANENADPLPIDEDIDTHRKSPAAYFGSQHIGAVVLPSQLQNSINTLISEANRVQLHSDAKRLFYDTDTTEGSEGGWDTQYDSRYRSFHQKSRHATRDGTAFASIALPAHYSAIVSVLDHIKQRIGPSWGIKRVIDWGAGTGSGLWASLYSFQKSNIPENESTVQDKIISNSTIEKYIGIEKRDGLVTIGKCLLRNIELGGLNLFWQKSFKDEDKIRWSEAHDTLALSAFMLTALPTLQARKSLVKEMWDSGAHTMVLLDHNTTAGFEAIAQAREYLLNMGKEDATDATDAEADLRPIRGSHVVAPCPHDGVCPLYHPGSTRLVCGFIQRIQRPSFVRLTKHSRVGHEDIEYSYVVIQRGPRPSPAFTAFGRIGEVGKRELEKEALSRIPMRELVLHNEQEPENNAIEETLVQSLQHTTDVVGDPPSSAELLEALRLEAYNWPRLVFPPLKKSGHVILDSCTAEGKIMRLTIPRSQGKQVYYDARKSSWGDIFPHSPKNPPQERYQPLRAKREGGTTPVIGADIGKRRQLNQKKDRASYEALSKDIRDGRKKSRKDRAYDF